MMHGTMNIFKKKKETFLVLHIDISILGKHVAYFYLGGPAHFCKTLVPILITQITTACIITCIFI